MTYSQKFNEYRLPANDIPREIRQRLHPWIAGFIGMTSKEANGRLVKRWDSIQRTSLQALRDTLTHFSIDAIIDSEEGGMIRAFRSTVKEVGCGDFWYLPAPLGEEEITQRLIPCGLQTNDSLREFLIHFAGLAEDINTAGNFIYNISPWPLFTDSWEGSIEGFDEWKNSLMLYHARNGCHALVRKDGSAAWWMMQEGRVDFMAKNFDEFIQQFNEYRKISWPFDPYGPPDSN